MKNLYYFVSGGGGEFRSIAPGASASNEKKSTTRLQRRTLTDYSAAL